MTIAKYLFAMLIAAIRKELTIQKPSPEWAQKYVREKKARNGADAIKGILILIIAPVIFFILAGLFL